MFVVWTGGRGAHHIRTIRALLAAGVVETEPAGGSPTTGSSQLVGTAALVAVVVGSGVQATELTEYVGLQLLADSTATVFGLGVLITRLGPVSGAHFNPAVTLAEYRDAVRWPRWSD